MPFGTIAPAPSRATLPAKTSHRRAAAGASGAPMESQIPRTTSPSPVERLRALARNMGLFWDVFTLLLLAGLTAYSFTARPTLLIQLRGWLLLALPPPFPLSSAFAPRCAVHSHPTPH